MSNNSYSVLSYHEETKHSELSLRMAAHYLDWENRPSPFKTYRNLPAVPLPRDVPSPRQALAAIRGVYSATGKARLDLRILAEVCSSLPA